LEINQDKLGNQCLLTYWQPGQCGQYSD